jgi:hypothetical protein
MSYPGGSIARPLRANQLAQRSAADSRTSGMFAGFQVRTFHVKRFAFSGKHPQLLAFKAKMFHVKRFVEAIKFRRKENETIC